MDRKSEWKQSTTKWGSPNTKDGSRLDYDGTQIFGFLDFWLCDFLDFFFLDNVLSGTPNTVSIGEGDPRYFGTSL